MATLTVRDAARRLGVKPRKVRLYISERKLSARTAPHASARRPSDRILLDADEVETLAQIRAQKRRPTPHLRPEANGADHVQDIAPVTATGASVEPAPPEPEDVSSTINRAEWRAAVVIQPLLQPLVVELHDARETIRRQAEELGALRATVVELQRRLRAAASDDSVTPPAPMTTLSDAGAETRLHPSMAGRQAIPSLTGHAVVRRPPLWQRALAHLLHGSLPI